MTRSISIGAMHARDLATGTLHQIVEASGVSRDEFLRLL